MTTKVIDNFKDFPARMSDGRLFTDYRSSGILNLHEEELKSTLEYRQYLQNNADKIIDNNYLVAENLTKCDDCTGYEVVDPAVLVTCGKEGCSQEVASNNGIGLEVNYVQ